MATIPTAFTEAGLYYYTVTYTASTGAVAFAANAKGTATTSIKTNEKVLSSANNTSDVYDTAAKVYNKYIGTVSITVGGKVYEGYLVQDTGANGTTTNGAYYVFLVGNPTVTTATNVTVDKSAGAGNTAANWNASAATPANAACFVTGTGIATPSGDVAVESLKIGDMLTLSDGRTTPVAWIGISTVSTLFADPLRALPIRIKQDALGEGLPVRDLLLSPDHALFLDGILVQAGALINGTSIVREEDMPEVFSYYHVEVADHSLILAENIPAETFVDNVSRMAFDNWEEHRALFGDEQQVAEMQYLRAKSVRQLPVALRARLGLGTVTPAGRAAA